MLVPFLVSRSVLVLSLGTRKNFLVRNRDPGSMNNEQTSIGSMAKFMPVQILTMTTSIQHTANTVISSWLEMVEATIIITD